MEMLNKNKENLAPALRDRTVRSGGALFRAKSLFDAGDLAAALLATEQILESDPDHLGALEVRVRALWRLGDFPAVLRTLRRLTALNPYEPGYFLMQGNSLGMLGRPVEARSAYQRCAEFACSPVREEALASIAEIDLQLGPSSRLAPVPIPGVSEFLPDVADSTDSVVFVERATVEDRPVWATAARPS